MEASLENALAEAAEKSKIYDWVAAASSYKQALETLEQGNRDETGRVTELLATAYFKGAFQARTREEFKRRMELAESFYATASKILQRSNLEGASKKVQARGLFASFWRSDNAEERREIIGRSISLAENAAQKFESLKNIRALAETHRDILEYTLEANHLAKDLEHLKRMFETTVVIGDRAIEEFEELGDLEGLSESLNFAIVILSSVGELILDAVKFEEMAPKRLNLERRLAEASKSVGTPYASALYYEAAAFVASEKFELQKMLDFSQAGVQASKQTKNSYLIGRLSYVLQYSTSWSQSLTDDAELIRAIIDRCLALTPQVIEELEISMHGGYLDQTYSVYAESYITIATDLEIDVEEKKANLLKAAAIGRQGLQYRKFSNVPNVPHASSKAMIFLARMEFDPSEKSRLLNEALLIRQELVRNTDTFTPGDLWDRGIAKNYVALVKMELSKTESDPKARITLLREASMDMRECIDLCSKSAGADSPAFVRRLASYEEWFGDVLVMLHGLSPEPDEANRAMQAYEAAAAHLTTIGLFSISGGIRWKTARAEDSLGKFEESAELFKNAAHDYRRAAEKIPSLSPLFQDLQLYMDAWSSIERARSHHHQQDYSKSADDYETATNILQSTRAWNFLSRHYKACSFLEKAEALSQRERSQEAASNLKRAEEEFEEAKLKIEMKARLTGASSEKNEMSEWLNLTVARARYCRARAELEEAKLLDKKGEDEASLRKYLLASKAFGDLIQGGLVEGRGELETMTLLCQAWAKMKEADIKSSPQLYDGSAELFLGADHAAPDERLRHIARANSSVCRALAGVARFRETKDDRLYAEIKGQLESAGDLYEKAGLEKATGWARATQRFFDAYVYLNDAVAERDPSRKAGLYQLAEKQFELAGRMYAKAGFTSREEESRKLLRRAREEIALLAPAQLLSSNPALQGSIPQSLLKDEPLGIGRFEAANIVGKVSVTERVLREGATTTVEVEVTNAGKEPATLMTLENIVPDGFEVEGEKATFPIQGGSLDLKGKKLDQLKSYSVKLPLRNNRKGIYEFGPRIVTVDGNGRRASYDFEAVAVIVEAPNLPGNLQESIQKGLGSQMPAAPASWFGSERGREVFQSLARSFLKDYMSKGIHAEKAGWRSLMDLVRELEIPKSAFYGPMGRDGSVLSELDHRGLVERRVFPDERGRGGAVTRVRVGYENPAVRTFLRKSVVESF